MKDIPVRDGFGTCNDCQFHSMDGRNHQCQNPEKPATWHKFINHEFARDFHDCCIIHKNDRCDEEL